MTPSTRSPDLVRLRVVWSGRGSELALPAHLPVGELVPAVAALVGALDPTEVHRGCALLTEDGRVLDLAASLLEQSVRDESVLTLVLGLGLSPGSADGPVDDVVHDDLVEAVTDALEIVSPGWGADDSRTSAHLLGGLALLGGAMVLGRHATDGQAVVVAGLGASILILLAGAVVTRRPHAASAAPPADLPLLAAGPYAAVAGFASGAGDPGRSSLSAGLALLLSAAAGFALGRDRSRSARVALILPWAASGTFAGVVGVTGCVTSLPMDQIVAVDLVGLVAVSVAVLRVVPPRTLGHRITLAGVLAVDLVLTVSAPVIGTHAGWAGVALVGVCGFLQAARTQAVLRRGNVHEWIEITGVTILVGLLVVALGLVPQIGPT